MGDVVSFRLFGGTIPRLPADRLPPGGAQAALNCDLAHGELRGLRGNSQYSANAPINGKPVRSVYTEDGVNFFAWEHDTYVVKSLVVEDDFYRIYYTAETTDGPFIKVARTMVHTGDVGQGPVQPVIGNPSEVGGNFCPPENGQYHTYPSGWGPHAWLLGIPAPQVQAISDADQLVAALDDRKEWPGMPGLRLRVLYFVEDPAGQIVSQWDITNTNTPFNVAPWFFRNVFTDTDPAQRGNKMQDTYANIGGGQRPYKHYFFMPPDLQTLRISRTVTVVNTGTGLITINYGTSVPEPPPGDSSAQLPLNNGGV